MSKQDLVCLAQISQFFVCLFLLPLIVCEVSWVIKNCSLGEVQGGEGMVPGWRGEEWTYQVGCELCLCSSLASNLTSL